VKEDVEYKQGAVPIPHSIRKFWPLLALYVVALEPGHDCVNADAAKVAITARTWIDFIGAANCSCPVQRHRQTLAFRCVW
jgi:hypothetical protein